MPDKFIPNMLSIAGSDPSGGAGIQADLKTFAAHGCYGMAVMAALTAQNTCGVTGIHAVPAEFVETQLRAIFDDVRVDAVKIGMIGAPETVEVVANILEDYKPPFIVLDPVMVATSGDMLIGSEAQEILQHRLMPLADVVTPNIPEGVVLLGHDIDDVEVSAKEIVALGVKAVLLKGGHLKADDAGMIRDVLAMKDKVVCYPMAWQDVPEMHGTGCTLSSALACYLALGFEMEDAVAKAQEFIAQGIRHYSDLNVGGGAKPLWHGYNSVRPHPHDKVLGEFDVIARYFAPLSMDGLKNDGAVLDVPEGMELVVSTDTLNEGVHFMKGAEPKYIASKALRANVSDLASMSARPFAYQLSLAFSERPDAAWFEEFSAALMEEQDAFGLRLSGGDTTTNLGGGLSVSVTVFGLVPKGCMVKRSGAQAGDVLCVTGTIGDAILGLDCLYGARIEYKDYFVSRYHKPTPRVAIAHVLQKYANAAVDISDGLLADAGHIASASGVQAVVEIDKVPLSDEAQEVGLDPLRGVTGGDDYELAIAVDPENVELFVAEAKKYNVAVTPIGRFEMGDGLSVLDKNGIPMSVAQKGWMHF